LLPLHSHRYPTSKSRFKAS